MNKIVFVIGATKSGGAEKRAILISKILKDKYDTTVFAFHGENNGDIDFVYRPSYSEYKQTGKSERIKALREYLVKEKPDFIFSFVPHINFFTTKALRVKELAKTKHILGVVFPKFKFPSSWLLKHSTKHADAIYYQCEDQKDFIKCKCPSFVIANPIQIPNIQVRQCKYKMISAGRLEPQKDYELMIKSFKLISNSIPEASLDIFGSGSQKEKLNTLIKELNLSNKVVIHDYSDDIATEYKNHDIFLFTTKFEGFPNVLAEAMANNLICFSTRFVTGCKDLLIPNKTGFICESRNPIDYADLVVSTLKDYDSSLQVAKAGYEHVKKLCDIESFKEKMIVELERLKNGKTN